MKAILQLTAAWVFSVNLVGCAHRNEIADSNLQRNADPLINSETHSPSAQADNSQRNERDKAGGTLTAADQGNSTEDIEITRKIRHLVIDTYYSTTAKNIKIITLNGKVTLRGPVNSEEEKFGIITIAKNIAGASNVSDQLQIKSNP